MNDPDVPYGLIKANGEAGLAKMVAAFACFKGVLANQKELALRANHDLGSGYIGLVEYAESYERYLQDCRAAVENGLPFPDSPSLPGSLIAAASK